MQIPELDGFEILEKLGEGGMASVWKARQVSLDRIVAIKVLSAELAAATDDVDRFQREARAAARLKHPGIVQVYDAKVEKGTSYFVMEYVDGYTVGDWIRRKGKISEEDALIIADCVADAMDDAWSAASIIHCDIKPDNIIIDADGTVKVADLGLSRTISAMSAEVHADEVMGTPAYISPEQAEGRTDLDCRADIYSLGAMLYHMLTGKLMFQGETDDDVMLMQVTSHAVDPRQLNPEISPALCDLLKALLEKNRDKRPRHWRDVKALLKRARQKRMHVPGAVPQRTTSSQVRINHDRLRQFRQGQAASAPAPDSGRREWLSRARLATQVAGGVVIVLLAWQVWRDRSPAAAEFVGPLAPAVMAAATPPAPAVPADPGPEVMVESNAREMYEFARQWEREHPDQFEEAMRAFGKVATQTAGTKYALMAEEQVGRLRRASTDEAYRIMSALAQEAQGHVDAGNWPAAIAVYEGYEGARQWETGERRQEAAVRLRQEYARVQRERELARQQADGKRSEFLTGVSAALLRDGLSEATGVARRLAADPDVAPHAEELQGVVDLLNRADHMDDRILDAFRQQLNREVVVDLVKGARTLVIVGVEGSRIIAREYLRVGTGSASSEVVFTVNELSSREKLARMGAESVPEVALVKGLMACRSGALDHARRFFEAVNSPLKECLLAAVDTQKREVSDAAALDALRGIIGDAGVALPLGYNERTWMDAVGRLRLDARKVEALLQAADLYQAQYGETRFAQRAKPVLDELRWTLRLFKESARPEAAAPAIKPGFFQ